MAQRVTAALEDDLEGGPADETVRFGLGGAEYEIDRPAWWNNLPVDAVPSGPADAPPRNRSRCFTDHPAGSRRRRRGRCARKLARCIRMLSTGHGRKTDHIDAVFGSRIIRNWHGSPHAPNNEADSRFRTGWWGCRQVIYGTSFLVSSSTSNGVGNRTASPKAIETELIYFPSTGSEYRVMVFRSRSRRR
jgi:Lsr2